MPAMRGLSFQSAPGLATGGNYCCRCAAVNSLMFQSAPGLATGGNGSTSPRTWRRWRFNPPPVSRPGETSWPASGGASGSAGFNPPPVSRPGETAVIASTFAAMLVSIRPRSRDRGKRRRRRSAPAPRRRFQSAPGLATGGNARHAGTGTAAGMFQSAPGLATGGNNWWPCSPTARLSSFNPPPVSRPGETPAHARPRHRRRSARFNPPPVSRPGETRLPIAHERDHSSFNPPPVSRPGETCLSVNGSTAYVQFQSAPGLATGGNYPSEFLNGERIPVSIRPRSRDRGKQWPAAHLRSCKLVFQSAPGLATGGNQCVHGKTCRAKFVSIRPRSRDRGKLHVLLAFSLALSFQSAPGLATGGNNEI